MIDATHSYQLQFCEQNTEVLKMPICNMIDIGTVQGAQNKAK